MEICQVERAVTYALPQNTRPGHAKLKVCAWTVHGIDKKVMTSIEDETACGRDEKQSGTMDDTNSGDDVDSQQVKAVRLAADSQYMRNDARQRQKWLTCVTRATNLLQSQ